MKKWRQNNEKKKDSIVKQGNQNTKQDKTVITVKIGAKTHKKRSQTIKTSYLKH